MVYAIFWVALRDGKKKKGKFNHRSSFSNDFKISFWILELYA